MVINFGYILKKARHELGINRSEMISILDLSSEHGSNADTVSVCRWENNTISPCHRRQVDLLRRLGIEMIDLVDEQALNLEKATTKKQIVDKYVPATCWDFADEVKTNGDIYFREITANDCNEFSYIFSDAHGVTIGQIIFSIKQQGDLSDNKVLVIKSIFCSNKEIMLRILNLLLSKVASRQVSSIIYTATSRTSHVIKFLKKIGFESHVKKVDSYQVSLAYKDVVANNKLFILSCGNVFLNKFLHVDEVKDSAL
ncbi:hypothetical protein MACH09_43130 [Vibrio sp. MACH09]|nr:hypothetical protein MACH09_43130 [Vibrio sp. MACH09]